MANQKIKNIARILTQTPRRCLASFLTAGLIGLAGVTAVKDNVHFGSVTLNSPQKNHYAWGILPKITIKGDGKGNMNSYGLLVGENSLGNDSTITGNMNSYGLLVGENSLGDNSTIRGNAESRGLICRGPRHFSILVNNEIGIDYTNHIKKSKEDK